MTLFDFIFWFQSEESDIPAVRQLENTLIPNGHATIPQYNQPVQITPNVGHDMSEYFKNLRNFYQQTIIFYK